MVNSPSPLNSRPPAPVAATPSSQSVPATPRRRDAGRSMFRQSNQIKPNQTTPYPHPGPVRVFRGSPRNPCPIPPPIKAENPCNRASSRQIKANAVFSNSPPFGQPTRWIGRTGSRKVETCAKVLPLPGGERAGVRASVTTNQSPFAPTRSQSRQKPQQSRQIKPHQGNRENK